MKDAEKELAQILRFLVYPQKPERTDQWISNRSLFDALWKWHEKFVRLASETKDGK